MAKENNTTKNIRRDALSYLTRRDHSRQELTLKLKVKGYPLDAIEPIILELVKSKQLSDERFVENYIYFRRNKGYGPERISLELRARGIKDETIAEHLQITDNAWFTEAHKVWQKRFKGTLPVDFGAKAKQMRFLIYRGFTEEHIESIFN